MNLLSCQSCRRQLNVTALSPGELVRCACAELLTVGEARDVQVRGLFCSRCGATVTPRDEACAHCSAELSRADRSESLLCPGCFCRLPDDSCHCKACGIRLRATALQPLPHSGTCPCCEGTLRHWVDDEWELVECSQCGGMWVPHEIFDLLRHRAVRDLEAPPQLGGEPDSALTLEESRSAGHPLARKAYVPCLTCGELMLRRQFKLGAHNSRIVLDVCHKHGTWFDRDELHGVLGFVAKLRDASPWFEARLSHAAPPPAAPRPPSTGGRSSGGLGELLPWLAWIFLS